jgi:hypothetical protein
VVAVADVHRRTTEHLARSSAANGVAGLDERGAYAAAGQVRGTDQTVVAGADHDGIEGVGGHPLILADGVPPR